MHELIDRLLSYGERSDAGTLFRFEGGARFFLADADALRSKQEPAGEPVGFITHANLEELRAGRVADYVWPSGSLRPENQVALYASPVSAKPSASSETVSGWRPIETADKDDKLLLLGIARHGRMEEVHLGGYRYAYNEDEVSCWWSDQADDEICPTHWMPAIALPASPDKEGVSHG